MRLRDESGFTLVELLVVMAISFVILSATLLTFETFVSNDARARKADQAQDTARLGVERAMRQLRNLANPTVATGSSIDLASPYDVVFLTSDPVKRRARYCLATSPGGASDTLWFQASVASATLTPAMTAGCPSTDAAWTARAVVAPNVVNRRAGADRNVFTYGCSTRTPTGQSCTTSSLLYPRILSARVDLYVDVSTSTRPPAETRLSSAVYLRNQNEPPTAAMATPVVLSPKIVRLNGSASDDPEGRTLTYQWFIGSSELPTPVCAGGPTDQGADLIGEGVTLTHTFPASGTQQIRLRVIDAGCLTSVAGPTTVTP